MFDQICIVHCVRRISDLAYREELESQLADDPLLEDDARAKFHYIPTVTREEFHTTGRINVLIDDGRLFQDPIQGEAKFDPATDRIMMCGSMALIKDLSVYLESIGFKEGSNAAPGDFVIERAFVG